MPLTLASSLGKLQDKCWTTACQLSDGAAPLGKCARDPGKGCSHLSRIVNKLSVTVVVTSGMVPSYCQLEGAAAGDDWGALISRCQSAKTPLGQSFSGCKSSKLDRARLLWKLAQLHLSLQQLRICTLYFTYDFLQTQSSGDSSSQHSCLQAGILVMFCETFCVAGGWKGIVQPLRERKKLSNLICSNKKPAGQLGYSSK